MSVPGRLVSAACFLAGGFFAPRREMQSSGSQGSKLKVGGAEDKLAVITQQIHDVRAELARMEGGKSGRVYSPPTDYSKKPKKSFHHPKLDIIYGEIIYSPYLTPPLEQ